MFSAKATRANIQLITFDSTGITRHPNHIALSEVYPLLSPRPRLLELVSPSIATKFTGPLWSLVLAVRELVFRPTPMSSSSSSAPTAFKLNTPRTRTVSFVSSPAQYITAIRAMLAHSSQLVWFRWLYVSFSHLMWVNQLIDATAPAAVA